MSHGRRHYRLGGIDGHGNVRDGRVHMAAGAPREMPSTGRRGEASSTTPRAGRLSCLPVRKTSTAHAPTRCRPWTLRPTWRPPWQHSVDSCVRAMLEPPILQSMAHYRRTWADAEYSAAATRPRVTIDPLTGSDRPSKK